MKTPKSIILLALLFSAAQLSAQTDKATTAKIIGAQNYIFVATQAFPLNSADINKIMNKMPGYAGGGTINLSGSNYDLKVTKDSVTAYLPYYGRSYTPRMGGVNDGGIKFNAKKFTYKNTSRKKGGWNIEINPKDLKNNQNDTYALNLQVTETGYGTLTINSNNQQTITFNGYISEPSAPKK